MQRHVLRYLVSWWNPQRAVQCAKAERFAILYDAACDAIDHRIQQAHCIRMYDNGTDTNRLWFAILYDKIYLNFNL